MTVLHYQLKVKAFCLFALSLLVMSTANKYIGIRVGHEDGREAPKSQRELDDLIVGDVKPWWNYLPTNVPTSFVQNDDLIDSTSHHRKHWTSPTLEPTALYDDDLTSKHTHKRRNPTSGPSFEPTPSYDDSNYYDDDYPTKHHKHHKPSHKSEKLLEPSFEPTSVYYDDDYVLPTKKHHKHKPTGAPIKDTHKPTLYPSFKTTGRPSFRKSSKPSIQPTATSRHPTSQPSVIISRAPSHSVTLRPTADRTLSPTPHSHFTSSKPSGRPTPLTSSAPSSVLSLEPTSTLTEAPVTIPTNYPSTVPSPHFGSFDSPVSAPSLIPAAATFSPTLWFLTNEPTTELPRDGSIHKANESPSDSVLTNRNEGTNAALITSHALVLGGTLSALCVVAVLVYLCRYRRFGDSICRREEFHYMPIEPETRNLLVDMPSLDSNMSSDDQHLIEMKDVVITETSVAIDGCEGRRQHAVNQVSYYKRVPSPRKASHENDYHKRKRALAVRIKQCVSDGDIALSKRQLAAVNLMALFYDDQKNVGNDYPKWTEAPFTEAVAIFRVFESYNQIENNLCNSYQNPSPSYSFRACDDFDINEDII